MSFHYFPRRHWGELWELLHYNQPPIVYGYTRHYIYHKINIEPGQTQMNPDLNSDTQAKFH